jgi:hypothetical protein
MKNWNLEYTGISASNSVTIEVPDDIRRNHTTDLKGAIRNWIEYFPRPTHNFTIVNKDSLDSMTNIDESINYSKSKPYQPDITTCEQHPLFHDLKNRMCLARLNLHQ